MSILYIIIISTINMMRNYTFLLLLAGEGHGDIYISSSRILLRLILLFSIVRIHFRNIEPIHRNE